MGVQVNDNGKREGPAVMDGIEAEFFFLKQHCFTGNRADFHRQCLITKGLTVMQAQEFVDKEAVPTAGASLRPRLEWHSINWKSAHRNVRRLQTRIVKALKEGKKRKVRALQIILTRSLSGKAIAVKRVTENHGKRTPGVDHVVWDTPVKKAQAILDLRRSGYRPQPLKRIFIPKTDGRQRPLSIPAMADRAQQALYLLALDPIAETRADPNSYGFRTERSLADAIEQCFRVLCHKKSAHYIMEADIKSCFDEISHTWLRAHIPMDRTMLGKWLKAGFVHQQIWNEIHAGVPQGGVISPALMNLTLDGLERELREKFAATETKARRNKVNLVRYCDDFIITGTSKEVLEGEVKPWVEAFLAQRGLALSPHKTRITHISEGFDFLGKNLRKYRGRLLIRPATKNVQAIIAKLRQTIKAHLHASVEYLIGKLNPIITGWATHHRHTASKWAFKKVDTQVFLSLWRWARKRHPNKNLHWVKDKYFHSTGSRNWVFQTTCPQTNGETQTVRLAQASATTIRRHVKIKGPANPYDPDWEQYFEARLGLQMAQTLKERKRLLTLWFGQQGICPVCSQKITKSTGWNLHHLVGRTEGGGENLTNLLLLHPNCHRQVHNQRLTVSKPRPPNQGV